ncbi:MAG: alpha/beta hydrolase [Defluviitaleaceae bacterium]|nr:alpha/beta hydrolase [Defluviitaleaceae bacterium]
MWILWVVLGSLVFLVAVAVLVLSYMAFTMLLKRDKEKSKRAWDGFISSIEAGKQAEKWTEWLTDFRAASDWMFGHDGYEKLSINSEGFKLFGHYVGQGAARTVIVIHGYGVFNDGKLHAPDAKVFYEMGYNVFLPDVRSFGESDGKYIGMGHIDNVDILAWIKHLQEKFGAEGTFVLHGASMGGAISVCAGGNPDLPAQVTHIIADSAFSTIYELASHALATELKIKFKPAASLIALGMEIWCKILAGYGFRRKSPIRAAARVMCPIFVIHGTADSYTPLFMGEAIYAACPSPAKKWWAIEGSTHPDCNFRYKDEEYQQRVKEFLK